MVLELKCAINNYSWGKKGTSSFAAEIAHAGGHLDEIDPTKPYAEFWVGTHKNGPAHVASSGKFLKDEISENPKIVGPHEKADLALLFKVLSVDSPLSIQIHPTKDQGKFLHEKDPKNYPDPNHKPEIAIALTEFELLSGFRPHKEIAQNIKDFPEIAESFGPEEKSALEKISAGADPEGLKVIFSKIWRSSPGQIASIVKAVSTRLAGVEKKNDLQSIIAHLAGLYPVDVGVLAPLFLNHFKMQPGEATFLEPNMPHAYLKGDCVECMACSDNTIRAGLTPKFIDVESLVTMLNYSETAVPKYSPHVLKNGTKLFTPKGIDEFWVQELSGAKGTELSLAYSDSSSIVTVIHGSATVKNGDATQHLTKGKVVFFGIQDSGSIIHVDSDDFVAFRALTPSPSALQLLLSGNVEI